MQFFILGIQPQLSLSEINAYFSKKVDFALISNEIAVTNSQIDLIKAQERLAGVQKCGNIIKTVESWDKQAIVDLISSAILDQPHDKKIKFGLSIHNLDNPSLFSQIKKQISGTGIEIKKKIKESGQSVRFVTSKEESLSSVVVWTNKLIETGGEFVLIATKDGIMIGQTVAVQNFKAWSERDFGRPARDAKSGMLPPKLARMMINLTETDLATSTLLDPYCGSGTVLMEAELMGYKKIIGSDISEKAIDDTEKNTKWLENQYGLRGDVNLYVSPADKLHEQVTDPVDAIVTETFLGDPQSKSPSQDELNKIVNELIEINRKSFKQLYDLMKPESKAVIAIPVYLGKEKKTFVPLKSVFKSLNFEIINPLPAGLPENLAKTTENGGILYFREGQRVGREILVLRKG
ncbi:TRM11 family SAM-dependent methyltransferase [Patescibacteria group bacterium]